MSRKHHPHRTHSHRLGDRRLKDVVVSENRRSQKDRRGFLEELRRLFIGDRRREDTPVEIEQRIAPRRNYSDQRRSIRDRRLVDMTTDPARERRKAVRRQAEIDRLSALDPTMSAQIAPQEVEDDLNRKHHK